MAEPSVHQCIYNLNQAVQDLMGVTHTHKGGKCIEGRNRTWVFLFAGKPEAMGLWIRGSSCYTYP